MGKSTYGNLGAPRVETGEHDGGDGGGSRVQGGADNDNDDGDDSNDDVDSDDGVHPNSHKHFIPYMGFCASIWDSVRHHCHHHHHHHDHQK